MKIELRNATTVSNNDIPSQSYMVRIMTFTIGTAILIIHHFNHRYIRTVIRY